MNDVIKKQLRTQIKHERNSMLSENKINSDNFIVDNLIKSGLIDKYKLILIYLSTKIEVCTDKIIDYCIKNHINVAIPRCVDKRKMNFYYYNTDDELEISKFGIYEPIDDINNMITDFNDALCIVPGLAFDKKGFRLGYGGGFYDTFISENPKIKTVGICYEKHFISELPVGEFDKCVDYVVTENNIEVFNG